jgi:dihydrofolate synthase / folylpolyglutamate synthase
MTYRQTLDFFYSQLPMYHRVGAAAYRKDLDNTLALCAYLGNPERSIRTIHVAGTNGKGSVSHFIAAILQAAGYRVGLYVSPHYVDFRERIKVNGTYIGKRQVTQFVSQHKAFIQELQPSFFEMTVGLAFDHFKKEQVDFAVIETGLGGRLDSTNVISPLLSVITNISWDHMALLGNTLPLIAAEKAGIIKPNTPVVIGEYQEEVWHVFEEKAKACNAKMICAQTAKPAFAEAFEILRLRQILPATSAQHGSVPIGIVDTQPEWLAANMRTALASIATLNETSLEHTNQITAEQVIHGLTHLHELVRYMGRWQLISRSPDVFCDSAHNEAGLRALWSKVKTMHYKRVFVVCGFANDKDLNGILPLFPTDAHYCFAKANVPRGLDADALQKQAAKFQLIGKAYSSVNRALSAARKQAQSDDLVVVTGSIFVLGEVLSRIKNTP